MGRVTIIMELSKEQAKFYKGDYRIPSFKGIKILNNLVWEILNMRPGRLRNNKEITFSTPKTRRTYILVDAEVGKGSELRLSFDSALDTKDIIVFKDGERGVKESMRFLRAGKHRLILNINGRCSIERLLISLSLRARGRTAKLTVSGWISDKEPVGSHRSGTCLQFYIYSAIFQRLNSLNGKVPFS